MMKARPKRASSSVWTLKEKKKLVAALQKYGFSDISKIAEAVGTKNESAINYLIESRTFALLKEDYFSKKGTKELNESFKRSHLKNSDTWSTIQFWKKIAANQHLYKRKAEDYSMVMCDILKEFYEAEPEIKDVGAVDVKAIYKYFLDCCNGVLPAVLKPLESTVVLLLFRDLRQIVADNDFKEAQDFISKFESAISFVPAEVKKERPDENETKSSSSASPGNENSVPVPNELFQELCQHLKLKDDINPLGIPLWLLANNQELIDNFYRTR